MIKDELDHGYRGEMRLLRAALLLFCLLLTDATLTGWLP